MKEQSERLGKEPVPKLLARLAVPAMIGLFGMALYNVVDTIYVAWSVGILGVAAVAIAFPVNMILMSLAGAIGIGGASLISRALGAGDVEKADKVFGNVVSLALLVGVIGAFLGLNLLTPILYLFGSSETILPYARDYLGIILYGTIFFAFFFSVNNIVRAEGNAKTAMMTMVVSAGLNIVLTPIFIFGLGMGIRGAALGTVLSQGVTAFYLLFYFLSGKSSLSFKVSYLRPRWPIVQQTAAIGSSAFVRQAAGSLTFILVNHMLVFHGGDLAVAVFGIIHKVLMFSLMPILGIVQGLLPLVGFNYGAVRHERVSESIILAMKAATAIAVLAYVIVMLFPNLIMLVFTNEMEAVQMGRFALRVIFALSFTLGFQMVAAGVFQALGRAKAAFVLSLSRQILFLVPLLTVLPRLFQLSGIWLAFPLADLLSFFFALWLFSRYKTAIFADRFNDLALSKL